MDESSKISRAIARAHVEQGLPAETSGEALGRGGVFVPTRRVARAVRDAEQYHTLAAEIRIALPTIDSKVVMFTGSVQGEGASLVAREFAQTLAAESEVTTVLVDLNFRAPSAAEAFRVPRDPGFVDFVLSELPLSQCLRSTDTPRLSVLPAGRPVASPARVLADPRVELAVAELRRRFGFVVIDMAPIVPFSEGVQFSRAVDGVVLVVRSGNTKRELVQRAMELLGDAGARVLGTVLNRRRFYVPRFIYERL
ncbi:MAG: CpsD/CapB family tyrosine-protein kinase [Candidatus Eisenbacteria bacterium]|nr:CpsD/CapB family tyrosine-protein kinase [Candidatus Eisenbacteria bacterium]